MRRLDENSGAEISGLLGYIHDLQRRFDLAVVHVDHQQEAALAAQTGAARQ